MSFKIKNTCNCLKETIIYIYFKNFSRNMEITLRRSTTKLKSSNCQSFSWFKIKNSFRKDYVKVLFKRNSKSIILKESKFNFVLV